MLLRTDGLLLGVLLAIYSKTSSYADLEPSMLGRNRLLAVPILLGLFFCLAVVRAENVSSLSHSTSIITLLSAALVFIASYDRDYIMRKGHAKKVLMWVGSRSYAIYVIHIPAFFMTREIWFLIGNPTSPNFNPAYLDQLIITAGSLTLLLSELNYRFIELPLRLKGRDISRKFEARRAGIDGAH